MIASGKGQVYICCLREIQRMVTDVMENETQQSPGDPELVLSVVPAEVIHYWTLKLSLLDAGGPMSIYSLSFPP